MADWYGHARSNYFQVKDGPAFEAWVKSHGLYFFQMKDKSYAIFPSYYSDGSWPDSVVGNDGEIEYFDVFEAVSNHLMHDQVAVFMEVGNEARRYVSGFALAINAKGEKIILNLTDIYQMAAERFGVPESVIHRAEC